MHQPPLLLIFTLFIATLMAVWTHKLTGAAAMLGLGIALLLFYSFSWAGPACMAAFFLMGTVATSWKRSWKEEQGLAEANRRARNSFQVLANSGVPVLLALLALVFPEKTKLCSIMMAAAFSSAAADTVSSELGMVYGKSFFNITSFRADQRGRDGVVSWEGINLGIMASLGLAMVYVAFHASMRDAVSILIAGTIGNLSDSILGATLERKNIIGNDLVNFMNTLIASAVILLF